MEVSAGTPAWSLSKFRRTRRRGRMGHSLPYVAWARFFLIHNFAPTFAPRFDKNVVSNYPLTNVA
jgi:hypothetical protein